jgi:competence protein ComEA
MISRRDALRWILLLVVVCLVQAGFAKKKPPLHPINLNTASSAELQQVPGIGPSAADRILQMRKSLGAFKSLDDLRAIKGIGPKKLDKIRKYLSVGKPAPSKQAATSAAAQAKAPPANSAGTRPVPAPAPSPKKPVEPKTSEEEEP